jgi:hypothetical protein
MVVVTVICASYRETTVTAALACYPFTDFFLN